MANWQEMMRKRGYKEAIQVPVNKKITSGDYNNGAYNLETIHIRYLQDIQRLQDTINDIDIINNRIYDRYHVGQYEAKLPTDFSSSAVDLGIGWIGDEANNFWDGIGVANANNLWASPAIYTQSVGSILREGHTYYTRMFGTSSEGLSSVNFTGYVYVNTYELYKWNSNSGEVGKALYFLNDYYHFGILGFILGTTIDGTTITYNLPVLNTFSIGDDVKDISPKLNGICVAGYSTTLSDPNSAGNVYNLPITQTIVNRVRGIVDEDILPCNASSQVNITNTDYGKSFYLVSWK